VLANLHALHISPFAPGAATFVLLILALGCITGLILASLAGVKGNWQILRVFLIAVALLMAADLSLPGKTFVSGISSKPWVQYSLILLSLAVVFCLVWLLRQTIAIVAFVTAATLFVTTLMQSAAFAAENRPPVIYIIMDEMIGLNGIETRLESGQETYDLARSVFEKHGFRLHTRAFSRHFFTKVSIPAILNFDDTETGVDQSRHTDNKEHLKLTENALFAQFTARGRPVSVYQSGHMDFCVPNVRLCKSFPSFNAESDYTKQIDPDIIRKANIGVIRSIFLKSYVVAPLMPLFSDVAHEPDMDDHPAYFDLHGFNAWFAEFASMVKQAEPDSLSFGHFLMPHGPALLDETCEITGQWESPYYLKEQKELSGDALETQRAWYYSHYYKQMQCGIHTLDRFLTMVESVPALQNATIVIQGDHGSRISSGKFAENLTPRDMIDNYSAFFAIRMAGLAPGLDAQPISVQRLTKLYLSGQAQPGRNGHGA
jgi:hypothetical protein